MLIMAVLTDSLIQHSSEVYEGSVLLDRRDGVMFVGGGILSPH